jgi:hypothetical protein
MRTLNSIKQSGFCGFKTIAELQDNYQVIPVSAGVYQVLWVNDAMPEFVPHGTGGFFKNKDPNVPISELSAHWVPQSIIIYIGKATSLRERLTQYLKFGQGKAIGHRGGRYIWQIEKSSELQICWKELDRDDPRELEKQLIQNFKNEFGRRPFANLKD